MKVSRTFSRGSMGILLQLGNSYQDRAVYGARALDFMYSLNTPMSHHVPHAKKNQPGNMCPSQPPCAGCGMGPSRDSDMAAWAEWSCPA